MVRSWFSGSGGGYDLRAVVVAALVGVLAGWFAGHARGLERGATRARGLGGIGGVKPVGFTKGRVFPPAPGHPSQVAAESKPFEVPEFYAQRGVTLEDFEADRLTAERQSRGEYILDNEFIGRRKSVLALVHKMVTNSQQVLKPRYDQRLAKLGVPEAARERITDHFGKVQEASLVLEDYMRQLFHARLDLEEDLKKTLSPEGYDQFKSFVESDRARLDLQRLNTEWQNKLGGPIPPDREEVIKTLINRTGAFAEPPQHGLYDGLPLAASGREMVSSMMSEVAANLRSGYERLKAELPKSGLTQEEILMLQNYYEKRISGREADAVKYGQPDPDEHDHRPPSAQ